MKYADGSTLLDKTFIVLTGEIADGSHNTSVKPMITIGGKSFIRTGRYVPIPVAIGTKWWTDAQLADLPLPFREGFGIPTALRTEGDWWAGVARALGVNISTFGNSARNFGRVDVA